jgi:hypothetical protein
MKTPTKSTSNTCIYLVVVILLCSPSLISVLGLLACGLVPPLLQRARMHIHLQIASCTLDCGQMHATQTGPLSILTSGTYIACFATIHTSEIGSRHIISNFSPNRFALHLRREQHIDSMTAARLTWHAAADGSQMVPNGSEELGGTRLRGSVYEHYARCRSSASHLRS